VHGVQASGIRRCLTLSDEDAKEGAAITTAAESIALEMKAIGVSDFFLVTGGDNSIWIALREQGIRQHLARSEASAVYMADAYARVTGRPTYVYGQYGPGAANVAGALAEPFWSASPVVAMPTSMRRQHRHRAEYQELEQIQLFAGVTKWQAEAQLPERIGPLVRAGAIRALSTPPGPVYIGMPSDALEQEATGYVPPSSDDGGLRMPLHRPAADPRLIERAVQVIVAAERPIVLCGNGVHQSRAYEALGAFLGRFPMPVATSLSGKGAIAETGPLAIGPVGRYSRRYGNALVTDADLVIAVGTRLGGLVTDSYRLLTPGTRIVHIDADPSVLGHTFPTDVAINADARLALEALVSASDARTVPDHRAWHERVASERQDWQRSRRELVGVDGTGGRTMRPEAVIDVIGQLAPDDTLLLADTGYAAAWAGGLHELPRAGLGYLRADGSLGWAFPASLGAKLAAPERPVVALTGDGGFGYHVGDLETAIRLGLPVIVVILNNQTLAFEVHVQELLYGTVVNEVDDFVDVDHAAVARAYGAHGFRVAFADALRRDGPVVIDAIIDRAAIGPVTRYDRVRDREL
jgi:acetolactate synthase I/II/III large subunit